VEPGVDTHSVAGPAAAVTRATVPARAATSRSYWVPYGITGPSLPASTNRRDPVRSGADQPARRDGRYRRCERTAETVLLDGRRLRSALRRAVGRQRLRVMGARAVGWARGRPARPRTAVPQQVEREVMEFDVVIEIPKGTRNKCLFDRSTGRIRLDRTLFTATQYPADYGFVDRAFGPDVDALDALVLVQEPTFPGCLIRCRSIGMFRMSDEHHPEGGVRAHRGPTPHELARDHGS
jgi:Inorganic pyrophosphatase